ncbi:MAG: hypothetical protein IIV23_04335 [Ruminococcus sp.]|nr:hypothetical protein [Ruminococcus sp.]
MVIYDKYTAENGDKRKLAYSDQNLKITRDGKKWDSADDFEWQNRVYEETDEPISPDEIAQKAEAFDYLTGRSAADE